MAQLCAVSLCCLLGLCVKRAPPYSQFTSKTRAPPRAYCSEHTTTAPPPPLFFHHYILFLCFSTKFWSSRLTRPTETRYYRAYITLHICVVVIKLVSFSKCLHNFYNIRPEKTQKKKDLSALQKQQYSQPLQNNKIIFKCLCVSSEITTYSDENPFGIDILEVCNPEKSLWCYSLLRIV